MTTANELFKRRQRRWQWVAAAVAVSLHVIVLLFAPPFTVRGDVQPRMVVSLGNWREPLRPDLIAHGYVPLDSLTPRPVLANRPAVHHRLPRLYPWIMWHHREPAGGLLQVTVSRSGHVRRVLLLDGSATGADSALQRIARMLRFKDLALPFGSKGIVGTVEFGIVQP